MSLSFEDMQALADETRTAIQGKKLQTVQEFPMRKWVFTFQGGTSVLFCFQEPFLRFHLVQRAGKGVKSQLQEMLADQICTEVRLLNGDRILRLTFSEGLRILGEFFPKRPNLYLLDGADKIIYALNATDVTHYVRPEPPEREAVSPSLVNSRSVDKEYAQREFQREKEFRIKELNSAYKAALKNIAKLNSQLKHAEMWPTIQHEGVLLQAHMYLWKKGESALEIQDWEDEDQSKKIALDPLLTAEQEMQKRFSMAKKYKKSVSHLREQILKSKEHQSRLEKQIEDLTAAEILEHLPQKKEPKAPKVVPKSLPYYEFKSEAGLTIRVGKSAKKNEELTFKHAHGSDLWMHVGDFPGSHVIVKAIKGKPVDRETVLDAMTLAIAYSKAKDHGKAEVIMAPQKNVSRIGKNAPGKVQVSQAKRELIRFDEKRLQIIKNRLP